METNTIKDQQTRFDAHNSPTLLLQAGEGYVLTANQKACDLFGKELSQIVGIKGGQVFDCLYSFSEMGCDRDPNCQRCTLRKAMRETFTTGKPQIDVTASIDIKKDETITPYSMKVSTKKIEDFILVTIDKYQKKA